MKNYWVLKSKDSRALSKEVTKWLNDGYSLAGSLILQEDWLLQAVVKDES